MGIPAVLGTTNATSTLHDGQRIRIDGTKGCGRRDSVSCRNPIDPRRFEHIDCGNLESGDAIFDGHGNALFSDLKLDHCSGSTGRSPHLDHLRTDRFDRP